MSAAEQLGYYLEVIEGGKSVAIEAVESVIADNGAKIVDITTSEAFAGNGATAEVAEIVNISEGATAGSTVGAGLFTMEVGAAGAAIAPALGVLAGVGLYNLAPDFWTNVSNKLVAAGQTIGGKVAAFINKDGSTGFSSETIEIVKNALVAGNVFTPTTQQVQSSFNYYSDIEYNDNGWTMVQDYAIPYTVGYFIDKNITSFSYEQVLKCCQDSLSGCNFTIDVFMGCEHTGLTFIFPWKESGGTALGMVIMLVDAALDGLTIGMREIGNRVEFTFSHAVKIASAHWVHNPNGSGFGNSFASGQWDATDVTSYILQPRQILYPAFISNIIASATIQPGAVIPNAQEPFPSTYPSWMPWSLPAEIPEVYPVSIPDESTTQESSQTGANVLELQVSQLVSALYNPLSNPSPSPAPDPDGVEEPDPGKEQEIQPNPNPPDPNPPLPPSGTTLPLPTLETTSASRMFTVYNPTDVQINSLGAYLWTTNIIEQIKQMWDDPMQAIIAFHKVYAAPTTGSNKNIMLGYLDSEVSAAEVTSQFVTVDCGTLSIVESLRNAMDYSPFVEVSIYLPFVGFVEIDVTDVMSATIHVIYRIDVYTGTCIAMLYARRAVDMPNEQLLYTFAGNAAQQLPLTASSFNGAIGALLGLAGAGISVASGGGVGVAAGAIGAAHSLTHEMVHIQRSGGLSANAGIMTPRKPFIVLSRQNGYNANGYNAFYGYPVNKTVYLSNTNGFVRVKAINYQGNGTAEERDEIVRLLQEGVIV